MSARKKLSKKNGANGHDESDKPKANGHDKSKTLVVTATEARRFAAINDRRQKLINSYDPEEHPKRVMEMVTNGATEREIIAALGISQPVLDIWRARHSTFAAALLIGKETSMADARVQRSLFEMANGYDQPATKIFLHEGEPVIVPYVEHVPKNVAAAKAWLANRDPLNWGRNPEHAQPQSAPSVLNVKMIQGMDVEQLRAVVHLLRQTLAPITAQSGLKRLDAIDITPEKVEETA